MHRKLARQCLTWQDAVGITQSSVPNSWQVGAGAVRRKPQTRYECDDVAWRGGSNGDAHDASWIHG